MSKIIFFNIPSHGHTNPTLRVVKELISRGHQVWYYSYNIMREKIESTGAIFVSCDDYDATYILTSKDIVRLGKDLAFSTKILVDMTLALDNKIRLDMDNIRPDCIVADSMALWGKAIAIKLGIPFVSSTTTFAFNKYSSKIMKQNILDLFKMIFSIPKVNKEIKRLQNKGYFIKNIFDIIQNDNSTHTIVYTSYEFQPYSYTFSSNYTFVGPLIRDTNVEIKKNRDKLVYVSMGTVNNNMIPLYKRVISALLDKEYQVIMSVGNYVDINEFGELPENIIVSPHVDQISILKQGDVFISHCGMNSVSESLYFGVPIIMLPQTSEQRGVAQRVFELGAGIRLHKSNSTSILNAVNKIFSDSSYKKNAVEISKSFRHCLGEKGAADKILKVCRNNI